jgi:mRNA-degrading endonuclease RelE of RelBE toxin-antitoxin system
MKSHITDKFRTLFRELPEDIQELARKNYKLFSENPQHPSLRFRHIRKGFYSIRISIRYRAIGELEGDEITWFWVGSHDEYDKILSDL